MPHIIVKLWKGKSEAQKKKLAEELTQTAMSVSFAADHFHRAFHMALLVPSAHLAKPPAKMVPAREIL